MVDSDALTRFALSIVWRASVCAALSLQLGHYETSFAKFLLGTSGLLSNVCVLARLVEDARLHRTLVPPQRGNESGYHRHWFVVCGAVFMVFVGQRIPRAIVEASLQRQRAVLDNGAGLLNRLAPTLINTISKGKLAREDALSADQAVDVS